MPYPIRVHTLVLPLHDNIVAYILSNPQYTVLVNERSVTKEGVIVIHLQYRDETGDKDVFEYLREDLEEKMKDLDESFSTELIPEYNYEPDDLRYLPQPDDSLYNDLDDDEDSDEQPAMPTPSPSPKSQTKKKPAIKTKSKGGSKNARKDGRASK